jgi:hypothetical protein
VQSPAPVYLATEIQDAYNNTGISDDSDVAAGNFDGKETATPRRPWLWRV